MAKSCGNGKCYTSTPEVEWAKAIVDAILSIDCGSGGGSGGGNVITVKDCFSTASGKVFVVGYMSLDKELNPSSYFLTVEESTDESYPVGTTVKQIPSNWTKIKCYCS